MQQTLTDLNRKMLKNSCSQNCVLWIVLRATLSHFLLNKWWIIHELLNGSDFLDTLYMNSIFNLCVNHLY